MPTEQSRTDYFKLARERGLFQEFAHVANRDGRRQTLTKWLVSDFQPGCDSSRPDVGDELGAEQHYDQPPDYDKQRNVEAGSTFGRAPEPPQSPAHSPPDADASSYP